MSTVLIPLLSFSGIFYFFKLHDYDNNQKLDGLEWMAALTDFHQEESEKNDFKQGGQTFLHQEAEAIVDELLEKHDKNEDGFIDFFELMNGNVNSLMTDLDKPPKQLDEHENQQQQQQQQQQQSSLEQEIEQKQAQPKHQTETPPQQEESSQQQQQDQSEHEYKQQQELSLEQELEQQQQQQQQQEESSSLEQEYEQKQEQ